MRFGDVFIGARKDGTVVKDPFNGGAPFAGNIIPTARINSVSIAIQKTFWRWPNFGNTSVLQSQNFRQVLTRPVLVRG